MPDDWTELDKRAVDTIRVLAADAVQKVGNGHPGTAMSLAPTAYSLFQRVMRHDPADPDWLGRDRFVLSCGHSSLTLYIQLFLAGYGLELDDLEALRTWGSRRPGHPEHGHTAGVEITTGPLGQGLASAVGMAMAARRERGLLDPDAAPGESLFDHHIYVIASDGDIEEGVTSEASSIAGRQELGNLDRDLRRQPDLHRGRHHDRALRGHRRRATRPTAGTCRWSRAARTSPPSSRRSRTPRPRRRGRRSSLLRTIIGFPAPTKMNTGKAHGAALGDEEVAAVKKILGFDPEQQLPGRGRGARARPAGRRARQAGARRSGRSATRRGRKANPERAALADRLRTHTLPEGWADALPQLGRRTRRASPPARPPARC